MILEDSDHRWGGVGVKTQERPAVTPEIARETVIQHFANKPRRIWWLAMNADIENSSIANAGFLGLIGLRLLWPGTTFLSNATYNPMAAMAPEWTWALLFMTISVLMFCGIAKWDADGDVRLWRISAVFATWIWAFTAVMMAIGNGVGFGFPVFGFLTVLSMHQFGRLVGSQRRPG